MAPQLLSSMEADELRSLGARVKQYQEDKDLTHSQMRKKFPGIGSDSTLGKIVKGNIGELDLEKQLNNYRQVVAIIDALGTDDTEEEELYDDLWPVVQLRRAFVEMMRVNSNARWLCVLGATGAGKTSSRKLLQEKYGQRLVSVQASEAWSGSPMAFLAAIIKAFGETNVPFNQVDRLDKVIELLRRSRICLLVEDAHHLGPRNLNVMVTLLDQTEGEFVSIAIETLWKKLESNAYEECSQLTGNRLWEIIRLGDELRASDVEKLLSRRVQWDNGTLNLAVAQVMKNPKIRGLYGYVRNLCRRLNENADGEAVTAEILTSAINEETKRR